MEGSGSGEGSLSDNESIRRSDVGERKRKNGRFTAEEKRTILAEAEQPGVMITVLCRKHGIAVTQFYRWRAVAAQGVAAALKADGRGGGKRQRGTRGEASAGRAIERLRAVSRRSRRRTWS